MKVLNIDNFNSNLPQKLVTIIQDIFYGKKPSKNLEFDISIFQLYSLFDEIYYHCIENTEVSFNLLAEDPIFLIIIKDKDYNKKISFKVIDQLMPLIQKDLEDINYSFRIEETLINFLNYHNRLSTLGLDSNLFELHFDLFKDYFSPQINDYSNFIKNSINSFESTISLVKKTIEIQVLKLEKLKFLNFKPLKDYQIDTILPLVIISWNWQEIILKELQDVKENDFSKKLEYINQCLKNLQEYIDTDYIENVYGQKIEFNALFDWVYEIENQYYTTNKININKLLNIKLGEFALEDIVEGGIITSEITPIHIPIDFDNRANHKIIAAKKSVLNEIREYFYTSDNSPSDIKNIEETLDLIHKKKFDKLYKLKTKLTTIKPNAFISRLLFKLHINENSYSLEDLQILHDTGCIVNFRSEKPINDHLFRNTKSHLKKLGVFDN